MFRDNPSAYDRLAQAMSDISDRISDLETQVVDRFNPRPSGLERARRALVDHLPSMPGSSRSTASRYLPEFLTGLTLPSADDARDSLRALRQYARRGASYARDSADDATSYLPDLRLPRLASFRRGREAQRGLDFLRERPNLTGALIVGGAVIAVGTAFYVTKKIADHSEEPDYDVVRDDGEIQVRDYDAMIVAETVKSGYHEKARRSGFETLYDYVSARNRSGKKIPMTVPVLQQLAESDGRTKGWAVRFVMPKKYTTTSLPQPASSDVELKEMPAKRVVAIRFSGTFNASLASKKLMALYNYLSDQNLVQKGDPQYAFYNPPWTPGFMRRNEILIEVER
ncbi:SOUL family heme-binding protein [Mangrovicella endophytica]|uniref:SOUL family heme-binding protein n=1 Tax=Mangrovicella endophytica TaxID=2066697 RepID=UPI000C9E447F|nr:heme-binding protein [Mangrovicella endophytica]